MNIRSANPKKTCCPCGHDSRPYHTCCGRYLDAGETAADAEILMRSRYTAYTMNHGDYLLATWHPGTRPASFEQPNPPYQWLGLTVKRHELMDASHAIVEFTARGKINGRAFRLHEISRFIREDARWFYVDGDILSD